MDDDLIDIEIVRRFAAAHIPSFAIGEVMTRAEEAAAESSEPGHFSREKLAWVLGSPECSQLFSDIWMTPLLPPGGTAISRAIA